MFFKLPKTLVFSLLLIALLTTACSGATTPSNNIGKSNGGEVKLILGAYTTPREAYAEIIPLFQK